MCRIGFVTITHPDYYDDNVREMAAGALRAAQNTGAEVLEADCVASTMDEAERAALSLVKAHPDGVILFLGAWVECSTLMSALREVEHLPVCIWGFPIYELEGREISTGSYVSYAMIQGVLRRLGIRHFGLLGPVDDLATFERLRVFVRCAHVRRQLIRMRIGLVGYTSMSIYTGTFNHMLLRHRIGPEVCQFDTYELLRLSEGASEAEKAEALALYAKRLAIADADSSQLEKAAKLLIGMRKLIDENKLSALCVKCQPELSKLYGMTACIPLSALADMNVVASCEGDVPLTVSMAILSRISGQPVAYGDAITHSGDVLKLSACGFAPISMAAPGQREVGSFDIVGFHGLYARYVLRPGRVTVARLIEEPNDGYKLLYFTGEGLPTKLRQGIMPALDVRLDGDVRALVEQYNGQHYAIAYGDWSESLEALSAMLGIQTVRV